MEPQADQVRDLAEAMAESLGVDIEYVTLKPAGGRRLLRIAVDRDGGVSLDDAAEISRAIAEQLDSSGIMGDSPYVLEVGSPGVSRPLTQPRHWKRNTGRLVRVVPIEGEAFLARITALEGEQVVLTAETGQVRMEQGEIRKAVVQVEFAPRGADVESEVE